jgi:hypothetical protein
MKRFEAAAACLLLVLTACGDDGAVTTTSADDGAFVIEVHQSGLLTLLVEGEPAEVGARIAVPPVGSHRGDSRDGR